MQLTNEFVIDTDADTAWNVLTDLAAYPRWWPSKLDVQVLHEQAGLIGSEFEVRPWMGRAFRCRFEELNKPHGMRLRFFGGALEGPGGFLIQPAETGSGTAVRYEIDVFARGRDVALLSRILPLQQIHASQMRSLLQSLAKRLRNLERENLRMAEESVVFKLPRTLVA